MAIHITRPAAGVACIEIDTPPVNAFDKATCQAFVQAFDEVEADDSVRAILLTGKGRAFCAGANLVDDDPDQVLENFAKVLARVPAARLPVVAALNGHCVGAGLEIALGCDIRLAAEGATFVAAGVNMGLLASPYSLTRLIGISRAKAMLLTGAPHDAATMERWGLLVSVHPAEDLFAAGLAMAARVASRAPLSVEGTKRLVDQAYDQTPTEAEAAFVEILDVLRTTDDHREAVAAFKEKRPAVFTRR